MWNFKRDWFYLTGKIKDLLPGGGWAQFGGFFHRSDLFGLKLALYQKNYIIT